MHPTPGCLPCKSRKKKCDATKPICKGCTRNYLVCVWPAGAQDRPRSMKGIPASALTIFSATPQPSGRKLEPTHDKPDLERRRRGRLAPGPVPKVLGPLGADLRAESRYLLDHYLHSTGKKASAHVGGYTPFTDALMPIVHDSKMLFETVLTFSSFHLAAQGTVVPPSSILEQHGLALRSLKFGITRYSHGDKNFGIPLFLSMLMLTCTEIANGGQGGSAFKHLAALRRLAPDVLISIEDAPTGCKNAIIFGRELYAYCLAISCVPDPFAPDDEALIAEASIIFSDIQKSGYTGALFGCSDMLYRLIPQTVSLLNKARRLIKPQTSCNAVGIGEADEALRIGWQVPVLLSRVSLWKPEATSDSTFQNSGRILQLALIAMLMESAHWANFEARVLCGNLSTPHQQSLASPSLDSQLRELVDEGTVLLEKMPPSETQIATTMCWSIVVLGSYATLPHHRTVIREYFLKMEAAFGFDNMKRSRLALEYLWAHFLNFEHEHPMAIADAMRSTGGTFILG